MIRQEYELNLIPYVSPLVKVNVSQYDRGSRELAFKFVKGETPFSIPSDASVKIQGLKGDDNAFEYAMTVSGNEAVIALQEQMTAVAGEVVCQVVLTKENGSLLGTANFRLLVEPSPMDADAITSETDIPILNTLVNGGDHPGQAIVWDGEKADWDDPENAKWGNLTGNIENQTDLKEALDAKVDAEEGKGLSSNDYTTDEKNKLSALPTGEEIATALGNKVDKVAGMGLSENSYTTAEKAKLSNLPTSSELEQDLAEKVDKVEGKGLSANDYSNADKGKLDALPTNAELIDTLANKADLGSDGKVPAAQLPSYVDDVLEYATLSAFPATGESGKIYVALDTGKTYRWSGNTYTEISESLALGETADTAYAGNKGKATTDALNAHLEDNVRHITDAERTSWNNKVDSETGKGLSTNDFTTAEKEKLAGLPTGQEIQDDFSDVNAALSGKQDTLIAGAAIDIDENKTISVDPSELNARDIPAEGIGYKYAEGNPCVIYDGIAEDADDITVDISPIQDLHGYDHPWVGGAGKNLYDSSIYDAYKQADGSYAGAVDQINISTYISSNLVGVELTLSAYIKVPSGSTVTNFRVLAIVNGERLYGNNATGNAYTLSKVTFTPQSTSDRILFTYSEKGDAPNVEFKDVQLEVGSTATSYEPYSNICPISGRTQVSIKRTKHNIWDEEWEVGGINSTTGINESASNRIRSKNFIPVLPNTDYYVFGPIQLYGYDSDKNYIKVFYTRGASGTTTTPENCRYIRFRTITAYGATYNNNISINYPSTFTTFEPYQGQSVTIQLGQTVYGGTLDVTAGVLTVRTANIASYNGETIGEPWWSSMDEYVAGTTPTTGAQVVYTLANPVTVTLTPQQLALLEGYNILTTDGDNIKLTYLGSDASNVQRVLNNTFESFAPVEQGIATSPHVVGSYISFNTQFCKVTQAISVGEIVQIGRNVEITTVAEELMAILAQISA